MKKVICTVGLFVVLMGSLAACQSSSPQTTDKIGTNPTQVSDKDGMTLLYVPAGDFLMGASVFDSQARFDEKPQHTVYLDEFWLDQTDVTNAMFKKFADATGYKTDAEKRGSSLAFDPATVTWSEVKGANWQHPRGSGSDLNGLDNHPVVQVSWNDATAYCQWAGRRLPTEAEWEKAARGADGRLYPWGNQPVAGNLLNFADRNLNGEVADKIVDDGYEFTSPVGHYPDGASPYGALDMSGNVSQWVQDRFDDNYYASSPTHNPTGPTSSASFDRRAFRGGAWAAEASYARASIRFGTLSRPLPRSIFSVSAVRAEGDKVTGHQCNVAALTKPATCR
jgi:eukaryotic-like serine/threonine-protein kinase